MDALTKWSATAVAEAKPRPSFRRLALLSLGGLLALAAAGYGYYWWAVDRFFQSTDDAYVGGDVTPDILVRALPARATGTWRWIRTWAS